MSTDTKRAVLAVGLSFLILIGWQHFFGAKNQPNQAASTTAQVENTLPASAPAVAATATAPSNAIQAPQAIPAEVVVNQYTLRNGKYFAVVNNYFEFFNFSSPQVSYSFAETTGSNPFNLTILGKNGFEKIYFDLKTVSESVIEGSNAAYELTLKLQLLENGKLAYELKSKAPQKFRFNYLTTKKEVEGQHLREFVVLGKDLEKVTVGKSDEGEAESKWLGIDFNYHVFLNTFKDKKLLNYTVKESGEFSATLANPQTELSGSFVFAKKEYDFMTNLDESLNQSIDYGIWSLIAVPILRALQMFYKFVPNYGMAIIFLTLLIRMLTFPLQYKSFKSMKKMQDIQPELTKLREKYKEDPQRLQRETMDLFKKAGANPLGGCLPLLLQMPIFFAFYKVLFNSTELMGAPFFLWIQDLSHKDPFYVLPVLMAGSMFLQQKMTPSPSTDPTQQKIMLFMPLIFGFIMKDLPSGLTLYIFVSTVLGMVQQIWVYKKS
jgi:YidC/Oxa1 family membrane protein insertase